MRIFSAAVVLVVLAGSAGCESTASITLDFNTRYQTIVGWEAHHQAGQDHETFPLYQDTLIKLAAHDLGINRIRIEAWSGFEQELDWFKAVQEGRMTHRQAFPYRFCTQNDNDDPNVINWDGLNTSQLDNAMETVVLPLKRELEARGEKLYINLTYDSFIKQCRHFTYIHNQYPEYAEFALAMFEHLQKTYGIVPDSWEVILEPDNSDWRGPAIGAAMVAAGDRLKEHGFTPDFVAPSTTSLMRAVRYFDLLVQVPRAKDYISELAYHRYGMPTEQWKAELRQIAERGRQFGIRTSMLEHIGSGYEDLHEDLKVANVSAWQQFTLAFRTKDNGAQYYVLDDKGNVRMGERTRYLRQYFRYIRAGATRIEATSTAATVDPVAFVHPNGRTVVVVKADGKSSVSIAGLPAGTYGVSWTTSKETGHEEPAQTIAEGGVVRANIPARGALTIYAK